MISPAVAVIAAAISLAPQQQPTPTNERPAPVAATAARADQAPSIDGRDADAVWQNAQRYTEFRQFEPKVDVDPSFKTEFRAAPSPWVSEPSSSAGAACCWRRATKRPGSSRRRWRARSPR